MIDTADLQAFLAKIDGGAVAVDLLKIGQLSVGASGSNKNKYNGKFRLALDMEDCLDRFYGGYYSDWACGGQWNRAYQFVQLLSTAFTSAHIEVIAFFDGTLKEHKKQSFERNDFRQKTISVLKHIRMIGTPPPKIWWLAPSGIRTCLRNAMRNLSIQVVQTVNDHSMEVIDYFHEHKLNGILGLHPDYIIANTNRYFSSHDLRLSYKGSLETKEFLVSKLLSSLSLTPDHLPFIAVFLGGYILLDEPTLKSIYQRINVDFATDFESRIKKLAEIVRNSPTNDLEEFIKHLNLAEWAAIIKESVEYYQRRGKFAGKQYLNHSRKSGKILQKQQQSQSNINEEEVALDLNVSTPLASETSEHDEFAKKLLNDVSSLVDDDIDDDLDKLTSEVSAIDIEDHAGGAASSIEVAKAETTPSALASGNKKKNKSVQFVYTLPGEVLKTSLNRHQRGIMDPRIYQLLTKKEIFLPQILEDEQYREVPSVHLFYRPARQMIYAILFNMYHQKYLCSKKEKDQPKCPEIIVSEWIWSPQNEYKRAEVVSATLLPWAVPTIQRLWFGTVFEDKQRRMKAFLSVMRSDSPLMLNRSYVPQHMLAMACVLRYIVTNPDRNILTRPELDAFLATAFSPHMINIEYTQELVLPGVHLRGVYLATLFMQGVETASLANDACGVPLPWTMTNPWLFFDGKLFHLKMKMSTYVQSLRELCDDHFEIVLKIERFRKAILEDVEHFLLPAHMDPLYRANFMSAVNLQQTASGYGKNTIHPIANIPLQKANYYSTPSAPPPTSGYYNNTQSNNIRGAAQQRGLLSGAGRRGNNIPQQLVRQVGQRQNGYQLKVGGVVVGSWAGGVAQKPLGGSSTHLRFVRAGVFNQQQRRRPLNQPLNVIGRSRPHQGTGSNVSGVGRAIARNTYGTAKINKNRTRKNRTKDKKATSPSTETSAPSETVLAAGSSADEAAVKVEQEKIVIKVKKNDSDNEGEDAATKVVPAEKVLVKSVLVNGNGIAKTECNKVENDNTEKSPIKNKVIASPAISNDTTTQSPSTPSAPADLSSAATESASNTAKVPTSPSSASTTITYNNNETVPIKSNVTDGNNSESDTKTNGTAPASGKNNKKKGKKGKVGTATATADDQSDGGTVLIDATTTVDVAVTG